MIAFHCVVAEYIPNSPREAYLVKISIAPQLHIVKDSSCRATGKENVKSFFVKKVSEKGYSLYDLPTRIKFNTLKQS